LNAEVNKEKELSFISEIDIEMDTKWINIYKEHCATDNSTENSSLISLLTDFFREELLDGDYHCSTCQKPTKAQQKSDLCLPLPNVLIIQLKRFTYDMYSNDKIDTYIPFPLEELDLDKYITRDHSDINQKISPTKYDLVAVSNHTGNLISGHYTTYAKKIENGNWYLFDDKSVRELESSNHVVTKNAYILVYVRKN
jgi:ubiquitin C-terminal hydrolase